MEPTFFASRSRFRAWLAEHHRTAKEIWVGIYKKGSGKPGMTYREAVDQALCFGWIDGIGKSMGDASYRVRFTPRRPGSIWSSVNAKRVGDLTSLRLMRPAGLRAFEQRLRERSGVYSHEQEQGIELDAAHARRFQARKKAWAFFQDQAPSYRKAAIWWVISAKKEETKERRLARLIDDSEQGRTIAPLTRRTASK